MTGRWIRPCLLLVSLLFIVGCDDFKTSVSYDRNADFSAIRTYAWEISSHADISALGKSVLVSAVDSELQAKGLRKVSSQADVFVTYVADANDRVVVNQSRLGSGLGPEWDTGVLGTPQSSVETYREGSVVVDIYQTEGRHLIWRGSVSGVVSSNPKEIEKTIKKATAKLFKKFPPRFAGSDPSLEAC